MRGFACSSDPQAIRDAAAALELAYRNTPDDPIVAGNLAALLNNNGELRILARHVDVRALRLDQAEISTVVGMMLESSERAGLLAELAADPSIRRGSEILAQFEILAPNNPAPYTHRFAEAARKRDLDAASGRGACASRQEHTQAELFAVAASAVAIGEPPPLPGPGPGRREASKLRVGILGGEVLPLATNFATAAT